MPLGARHQRVQRLRRLLRQSSYRREEGAFVIEGATLVGEALDAGIGIEAVFTAAGAGDEPVAVRALEAGHRVHELGPGVLERVAGTVTPQPVLAVARRHDVGLADARGADLLVVTVDVRDPGNLGTVLRSAEAAGAGGVVCCDGTVDVFNPKTVRASAGSVFHVPIVNGGAPLAVLTELGAWGVRRLATAVRGGVGHHRADLVRPFALVVGNEASGLPADVVAACDETVSIPIVGRSESLNVGMATAVICMEAVRQRGVDAAAPTEVAQP